MQKMIVKPCRALSLSLFTELEFENYALYSTDLSICHLG